MTEDVYNNLKQQVETENKNTRDYLEDKYNELSLNHENNLSYIISLSISLFKLEKEFNEYKEYVDNEYVKVLAKMNWFKKILFRIIFRKDK